jgi:hypothetical protein
MVRIIEVANCFDELIRTKWLPQPVNTPKGRWDSDVIISGREQERYVATLEVFSYCVCWTISEVDVQNSAVERVCVDQKVRVTGLGCWPDDDRTRLAQVLTNLKGLQVVVLHDKYATPLETIIGRHASTPMPL